MRWSDSITNSMDMNLSKLRGSGGQRSLACYKSMGSQRIGQDLETEQQYHLAVQGTLKSLLQHHNSKPSILQHSAFFIVQLSHPYMTTGKTIALTIWTFVSKMISLLFNILSRLVIAFLPRSKRLLISRL